MWGACMAHAEFKTPQLMRLAAALLLALLADVNPAVRAKASWDGDDTDWNLCIREDDPRKQWTLRGG